MSHAPGGCLLRTSTSGEPNLLRICEAFGGLLATDLTRAPPSPRPHFIVTPASCRALEHRRNVCASLQVPVLVTGMPSRGRVPRGVWTAATA